MQQLSRSGCGLFSKLLDRSVIGPFFRHTRRSYKGTKLSVVLTTDVKGLGQHGDVVEVSRGYARNKLIPSKVALPSIDKYLALVKEQREQLGAVETKVVEVEPEEPEEVRKEKMQKEMEAMLKRLSQTKVVLRRDVGESTTLRQSVTVADLIKEVRRQLGIEMWQNNLSMPAALTALGEYQVPVILPADVDIPGEREQLRLQVKIRRK